MGRQGTGALTTGEVLRIELSYLLRQGLIKKGYEMPGILTWTNGSKISFASTYSVDEKYLRLVYTITSNSGEAENFDYKIKLTTIPSNLGRGEILYFVCPITGRRARILYNCYGSKIWKSREAYNHRIYYASQQCSKYYYHNTRYWNIDKQLQSLNNSKKSHYKGKETRLNKKISLLRTKQNYHDYLRWQIVPKAFLKGSNFLLLESLREGLSI